MMAPSDGACPSQRSIAIPRFNRGILPSFKGENVSYYIWLPTGLARGGILLLLLILCSCTTTVTPSRNEFDKTPRLTGVEGQEEAKIANLPYSELINRGRNHLRNGNTQLARLHFSVALQQNPDSAAALAGLGTIFYQENLIPESTRMFKRALEKDPENTNAMLYLGKISREEADLTASIRWLDRAVEINPDDPEILTELAITNDTIGQEHLAYAEPLYRKVVELLPHLAAPYNNLGFNLLLQGRYSEAINTFSKALSLAPRNPRAKNNLATAYLLNGETDKALSLFENTVGKAAAYNNLGYILMTQGNWDQAEAAFKKALNLNPSFYLRAQQNLERLKSLRTVPSR
jgi:Flp pilus assembly protein TadD